MGEEKQVLPALSLMDELISDHCQLGFKENQDAGPITEAAVLKVNESNKIREIYRAILEIPENRAKLNWGRIEKSIRNGKI